MSRCTCDTRDRGPLDHDEECPQSFVIQGAAEALKRALRKEGGKLTNGMRQRSNNAFLRYALSQAKRTVDAALGRYPA